MSHQEVRTYSDSNGHRIASSRTEPTLGRRKGIQSSIREEAEVLQPLVTIVPSPKWPTLGLGELWQYRGLLFFLVWRDLKVRYKQTALGVTWAVLQPFMTMVVFSVFFGSLADVPSDGYPYPVFTYAALLPWQLFSHALSESANSLVTNESLITKVYFPRLVIPLSAVLAGLVDFALAFMVLVGMLWFYGIGPTSAVFALPLFVLLACISALAVGLWLSALNVRYRDVRHTLPFLTQIWLFATPIAYPMSIVPEQWRTLYGLNPMVGVVEGFRWCLLGQSTLDFSVLVSTGVAIVLLVGGLFYFRHSEKAFADVI